jgi:sugar/nucleoside kinase (ribokinase family)
MRPFLSVYGHVSIDQIMSVADFPQPNTSVNILSKETRIGGTGTNISVMAASLGVPTAICSFVGRDMPSQFEDFMRSKGVIMDELVKVDGIETSQAMIVNDSGLVQKVLFYQGPQGSASSLGRMLTKNAEQSKYIHFCTGEPKYYISLMKELADGNRRIGLDPSQEVHKLWNAELYREAYELSDAIFCNQHEAESVMRYLGVDSLSQVRRPLVICTEGSDGCDVYIDGKKRHFGIVRSKRTVDATGAGDGFRAGFYAGLFRGMSIEQSVVVATAVSSFVVEAVGALSNIPTWDAVMERADKALLKV